MVKIGETQLGEICDVSTNVSEESLGKISKKIEKHRKERKDLVFNYMK